MYTDDKEAPFDVGTTATYSCIEGFYLDGAVRTCEGTEREGVWSESEPQCVGTLLSHSYSDARVLKET